jgi:hypothetical protein
VVTQYDPDASGSAFLERAKGVIEKAGFGFRHERFKNFEASYKDTNRD